MWDRNISLDAKGVYVTLIALPKDLRTVEYLCANCPDEEAIVIGALKELMNAGYYPLKDGDDNE